MSTLKLNHYTHPCRRRRRLILGGFEAVGGIGEDLQQAEALLFGHLGGLAHGDEIMVGDDASGGINARGPAKSTAIQLYNSPCLDSPCL